MASALLTKTDPVGLDAVIDTVQRKLFSLKDEWGADITVFPRCYILQTEDGKKTIEAYMENDDYSGTLIFSEGNKLFFIAPNDIENRQPGYSTTEIELFVIVNTKECKPDVTHRADEEVRLDVIKILERIPEIKVNKTIINIDRVFNRYNSRISQSFEYEYTADMQPYHCFKIEMTALPYPSDLKNCTI